ncbi:MotE family protein [Methylobacterium sp. JK268]
MSDGLRRIAAALAGAPRPGKAPSGAPGAAPATRPATARTKAVTKPSWRGPSPRLRLVDAVALAAGGLLVLKLVGLAADEGPGRRSDFARVLSYARSGEDLSDPSITGSVTPKEEGAPEAKAAPRDATPPVAKPPGEGGSPAERAILERLGARRDALQQRNRDLDTRQQLIENAERHLESRINDLKTLEDKAEGVPVRRGEAEAAGLKPLVTMYETMKPKEAARVFDRLSLDVLVPVVVAMNPRKMAEVLAMMQPETAEKLTVALAMRARGAAPPTAKPAGPAPLPPNELPAIDPGSR